MKNLRKMAVLLIVAMLMITGCIDEPYMTDITSKASFSVSEETDYNPENLYWAYKAEITIGDYSTGVTEDFVPFAEKGLESNSLIISIGEWSFDVKGYADRARSVLVYEGEGTVNAESESCSIS